MSRRYPADRSPEGIARRRAQIIELSRKGLTVGEICERVGVGHYTVVAVRKDAGISKPRAPRLTEEELARAEALLADGASYCEVGRTLGRSRQHIARLFPGVGWSMEERDEFMCAVRKHEGNLSNRITDSMWRDKKTASLNWLRSQQNNPAPSAPSPAPTTGEPA